MIVVKREEIKTHHHFCPLTIQKRKLIKRKVLIRYPAMGINLEYMSKAIITRKTLPHNVPWNRGAILAPSFLKDA